MLAIIEALKDWRHFLEGLPITFEIMTDHKNLEHWRTAQDLSRRQARWSLWLSRFNFILRHKPGKTNTQAWAEAKGKGPRGVCVPRSAVLGIPWNRRPPQRIAFAAGDNAGPNTGFFLQQTNVP